jgi:ABC-type transport system involved in multi-copper enzyme maturation permease subunit
VALDVGLSGIRFSLVLFALFWVQDFLTKEVERKTVLFSLTYPVSRGTYLAGRLLGIFVLLIGAALLLALMLLVAVLAAGKGFEQEFSPALGVAYWMTIAGLLVSVAVVAAFGLFVSALSTVPLLPFAVGTAFAIAGQSLGPVAEYLAGGADGQDALVARYRPLVESIRWILPDLSRLDWRNWPMYGAAPEFREIAGSLTMALAYVAVMYLAAHMLFRRREFS